MKKVGLNFALFTIQKPSKDGKSINYLLPKKIGKTTLSECIYNFMKTKAENYEKHDEIEKVTKPILIEVIEHKINKFCYYNEIHGIIKSGTYGIETEIINVDNNKKTHQKTSNEAEIMPFGFSIFYKNNSKTMVLVTQSNSNYSILTTVKNIIFSSIHQAVPDGSVNPKFHSMIPHNYFNYLINNFKLKSLNVITNGKHNKDISEAYSYEEEERIFKKFRSNNMQSIFSNIFFSRKVDILNNEIKKLGLIEDDEEADNIKLIFNINGKPKSVNYDSFFSTKINEDITQQVALSKNQSFPDPKLLFKVINDEVYPYLLSLNIIKPIDDLNDLEHIIINGFNVNETINEDKLIVNEVIEYNGNVANIN